MIEYRQLTPDDRERCLALESYAFQLNPELVALDGEELAQFRGLFVDGQLVAQLQLHTLQVQLGAGVQAAVGGIGAVASTPELRRRGYIGALLRHAVDELRASGVGLAMLYPFKVSFYGRYGWATCMEQKIYSGEPALFRSFRRAPGHWIAVGEDELDELDAIYREALRGRFGPVVRTRAWWRNRIMCDWQQRRYHGYIWRDEHGKGRSYTIFRFEREARGDVMHCREMVAVDPIARAQLFVFLAGHEGQVARVEFRAPADAPVNLLFPDPLECRVQPYFMLRLLDIAAAFEAHRYPKDLQGQVTIAVTDDWLVANQQIFALEFAAGTCQVRQMPLGTLPDIKCDSRILAQIYSRYLRPRTAATFGTLEVYNREALALFDRAFMGLVPFSVDMF
ncbi:enhanced intracellular survival protein Eis [Candidatus Chloroploca sp. Khr17]|uniref:GNAT family N-acetyltransferase n=1 Tax=Candidatus Chloroploca sp. Khr17 TaxID=2496869 RepID=UPI00101C75A1|nr:GNAT family N-acetyltransferase [Candidatus Chloroploca sp. Khr17]